MSCFLEEENGKKLGVLIFTRKDLLYDIENNSYIEGSIMETDSDHRRHTVQDVGQEGNVDRVTRVLDLTVAQCRELLYPYTHEEIRRPILQNHLKDTPAYGIVLKLPQKFSQTTLSLLEKLVHELLVCRAVADWMSITNPAKKETWKEKAEDALSEVRTCINSRMTRVRRRTHPF